MKIRTILGAACALVLAGCQTFEHMDSGLSSLRGQHYQAAISVLGFPDAENHIAGKRVFSWGTRKTGSYTLPTYSTSTAYVNGRAISVQTQGSRTQHYDYYCQIDVIVGTGGLIEGAKYDGNLGGCERYGRLFAPKKSG